MQEASAWNPAKISAAHRALVSAREDLDLPHAVHLRKRAHQRHQPLRAAPRGRAPLPPRGGPPGGPAPPPPTTASRRNSLPPSSAAGVVQVPRPYCVSGADGGRRRSGDGTSHNFPGSPLVDSEQPTLEDQAGLRLQRTAVPGQAPYLPRQKVSQRSGAIRGKLAVHCSGGLHLQRNDAFSTLGWAFACRGMTPFSAREPSVFPFCLLSTLGHSVLLLSAFFQRSGAPGDIRSPADDRK